ncbi:hypothetical protein B0H10DRAFT_1054095 [Mycena sp. CBHHK59/15]|nr:hypothetical protein B0H10DRAFT_1054095 [Mycena sp. CBHHK59/15]
MLFELQPEDIESSQLCLSVATKEVCRLQDDLASLAARQFSNDDFEKKWAQLTDTRRGALVLEALVAAASVGPDMESRRNWCPEMTVEFLARDRGKNLIDLLDQLMPEDLTQPITEPLFIPNKAVDLLFQPLCKRAARGLYVERAYFLTLVLWRILLAFYELKEDYIIGKSPRSSGSETKSTLQPLSELLGKEYIQTVKKVYKAERAEQAHTCWECGKPEEAGRSCLHAVAVDR